MNGDIEHIEQLNPTMFNKAEGITFYENGDMLITNEGQDKKPTLLFFKYKLWLTATDKQKNIESNQNTHKFKYFHFPFRSCINRCDTNTVGT